MNDNRSDFGVANQEGSSLQDFDDGPLQVDSTLSNRPGAGIRILSSATVLVAFTFLSTSLFIHDRHGYSSTYSSIFPHIAQNLGASPELAGAFGCYAPGVKQQSLREQYWLMKIKLAQLGFGRVLDEDWSHTYNRLEENEQAIYSQIFQLPSEVFREYVSSGDLRASFVLILFSPSLIDHLRSHSATESPLSRPWKRRRFWSCPFPLGSTDKRHRTEAELALESFAFSVPLIRLLEIPRKCPITPTEQDEDNVLPWLGSSGRNEQLFQDYPFIITWTQLRVADEIHLFDKEAFDKTRSQPGRYINP
ncbi:hypothetical protein C8J56DRAFT_1073085 [Mycena floridula]|nr:hypothetical protein C8J56DRAFT_1073085 [Mycena floridula]